MRIPEILKQLPGLKQKNAQILQEFKESSNEIEALNTELQLLCSHPKEYIEEWNEDDSFDYRCTACGKIIPEEDI